MKAAVLVIDMLEDFFLSGPLSERRGRLTAATNRLVIAARDAAVPVIWVRQEFESDLSDAYLLMKDKGNRITIRGTNGCKLLSELDVSEADHEIIKKRYSAFFDTDLEYLLVSQGIEHLIMAGVNTHACIRSSAVDAYQRDYRVTIALDAVDSYDENYHVESLRYFEQSIGKLQDNDQIIRGCLTCN